MVCCLPHGYFLMIIDQKVRLSVHVGDEEGEDNVDSKEGVDNVVHHEHGVLLVRQECKLEGGDPRGVDDQDDQKHLPRPEESQQRINQSNSPHGLRSNALVRSSPISGAEGRHDVFPEPRRLVDPSSQGRDEVTGEEAAVHSRARLKILHAEAS